MFNLVVPKHFYMNSSPVIIIDKLSDRFGEPSGEDVSVHTSYCVNLQLIDLKSGGDFDFRMWLQTR